MEKQWYALRTQVGYEQRVKAALQQKIRERGQEDAFGEIVVPTEKVIDLVRGKKRTVERRLFPGYLLVEMAFNQETWHVVHSLPKVVGFIGESDTAPTPIPAQKVQEILQQVEAGMATPRPKTLFTIGERVKVVEGPFRDFTGTVEAVKPERARVRVAVSVFGRPTPIELDFLQVEAA
ncbi:MAG TPA: transcription termination/antitermination protein NusG [Candidatus Binatia bacterium]|jgi:transcriptional antiterminator NusG|nr:transcription termination/antitermination protein NusG [Candidatus Binatia bacterium]